MLQGFGIPHLSDNRYTLPEIFGLVQLLEQRQRPTGDAFPGLLVTNLTIKRID